MRAVVVAGVAAGLVLAGCGSAPTSAPVESGSASGAVMSADECPANSPVLGILRKEGRAPYGVYGNVYNETGHTVWVWSELQSNPAPCRLERGARASFAAAMDAQGGPFAPWRPPGDERFWLLFTDTNYTNSPGTAVGLWHSPVGYTMAASINRYADGDQCDGGFGVMAHDLKVNDEYRLTWGKQGSVLVKRLADSQEIAREWVGTDRADDWARLDLYVEWTGWCL